MLHLTSVARRGGCVFAITGALVIGLPHRVANGALEDYCTTRRTRRIWKVRTVTKVRARLVRACPRRHGTSFLFSLTSASSRRFSRSSFSPPTYPSIAWRDTPRMRARSATGRSGYLRYNRRACSHVGPLSCHVFPCCPFLRSVDRPGSSSSSVLV